MGRALRAAGPASGRSGERSKKIGQPRTKRKKRKRDLEELHRNVLEAKRNARYGATQHKIKWKTNFAKVLNSFADKRRDNVDVKEVIGNGKPGRLKSKTICDRLLPEPMVGMYQNGAKGREIRRAVGRLNETNVARLRGNVLKLLKGEETNPKSSWEREEDEKEKTIANLDRPSDDSSDSDESDCEPVIRRLVKDDPVLEKTKGVKRINREKMRIMMKARDETRTEGKDQLTELPRQRDEDKCKRRLFEPDEMEDETAKNSFGIIDRELITDHEIRFSPCERNDDELKILNDYGEKRLTGQAEKQNDDENSMTNLTLNRAQIGDNFWGWSPVTCYERLCAMICIDNFENNRHNRQRGPDPVVMIQNTLRGLYVKNCQYSRKEPRKLSSKRHESRATVTRKSILTSTGEYENQACTQDSDIEECYSSESSITMIGSWHPENVLPQPGNDDTAVSEDKNVTEPRRDIKRTRNNQSAKRENDDLTMNNDDKNDVSSSDTVEKTINTVSEFLKRFKAHNPLNRREKDVFQMGNDECLTASEDFESSVVYPDTPLREFKLSDDLKCAPRRNIKHVPTILRRSNGHSVITKSMNQEEKSRTFFSPNAAERSSAPKQRHHPNDENSLFPVVRHLPPPVAEREIPSTDDITISPFPSTIFQGPNYYQHRSPTREKIRKLVDQQQQQQLDRANVRKSKINCTHGRFKPIARFSSSEELEVQASQNNDYVDSLSDRNIETTSRNFVTAVSMENNNRKNPSFCHNRVKFMVYQMGTMQRGEEEDGDDIFGKKVISFNDSNLVFDANDGDSRDNAERSGVEHGKNDYYPGKKGRETLSNPRRKPRQDNPQGCKRFSSFEFPLPDINPRSRGSNDPSEIAGKKFSHGNPEESMLLPPVLRGRGTNESSMAFVNEYFADKSISRSFTEEKLEPSRYAELDSRNSKQQIQSQDGARSLENFQRSYDGSCPTERPKRDSAPTEQNRGIIKKPVVLFRPIEETRQKIMLQTQIRHPVDHHDVNPESTAMREAVRNLRVMAFEDNIVQLSSQRSNHFNYQQSRQQRFSPSRCDHQQWAENPPSQLGVENFESYSQPSKFLAYEQTNGAKPRRIPIYGKSEITGVPAGNNDKPEMNGAMYVRSVDFTGKEQTLGTRMDKQERTSAIPPTRKNYIYGNDCGILVRSATDIGTTEQQSSRRVATRMVPLLPIHYRQTSNVDGSILTPATRHDSTSNEIMPAARIVYGITDRERLSRAAQLSYVPVVGEPVTITREPMQQQQQQQQRHQQTRYEMNVNFGSRDFGEPANLAERIQLPDGRIGILLAENSTGINRSQCFDDNAARTTILPNRIDRTNSNVETRRIYELANNDGIIYSQPEYGWNMDYDTNEAYHRG